MRMRIDNMSLYLFILLILLISTLHVQSQRNHFDADTSHLSHRVFIPAAALIAAGLLTNQQSIKDKLQEATHDVLGYSTTSIDDYLQFVPTGQMALHLLSHAPPANKKYHLKQYLLGVGSTLAITHGVKHLTSITRPNGRPYAFPSGHTSFAFSSAAVAYHILHDDKPFWAWMSYAPAIATGILRVTNDDHWIPDVAMGAGLGLLTTHLAFFLFPQKHFHRSTSVAKQNIHFDIGSGSMAIVFRW